MSSPRIPSPDPQALGSTDQRTVLDFHRSDDLNANRSAHHHDLGSGFNQGSPGSHIHDGTDSVLIPDLETQKSLRYPWAVRVIAGGGSVPSVPVGQYAPYGGTYDSQYGYNSSAADVVATRIVLPYEGLYVFNLQVTFILYAAGEASATFAFNDVAMSGDADSFNFVNVSGVHYWRNTISHIGYHPKNQQVCSSYWQATGQSAGYNIVLSAMLVNRIS